MEKLIKEYKIFNPTHRYNLLKSKLQNLFPETISIYQRAYLSKESVTITKQLAPVEFEDMHFKIGFGVTGEIKGFVICDADLSEFSQNEKRLNFVQGLFVESMNILLGKILTDIEDALNILCYLTPPKILHKENNKSAIFQEMRNMQKSALILESKYGLKTDDSVIPCRLCFEIIEDKITEV